MLLTMTLHRTDGRPCHLAASYCKNHTWRWQVRSKPILSGTQVPACSTGLERWLKRNQSALDVDSALMVEERIRSLRPHDAALAHGLGQRRALPRHAGFPATQASASSTPPSLVAEGPPQPLSWQDAQELASARISTYRHLPPKCRSEISLLVQNLLHTPQSALRTQLEGPDYLLILPKLVWPVNKARGKLTPHERHTEVAAKLRLAAAGHWQDLHRLAMHPSAQPAVLPAALPPNDAAPADPAPTLPLSAAQAQCL
eukprot:2763936-Amphidinium_carterae.2